MIACRSTLSGRLRAARYGAQGVRTSTCRFSTSRSKARSASAKTSLAERLATRLDATAVLEDEGQSLPRRLLHGRAGRGAAGAVVLPAQSPSPAAVVPAGDLFSQTTVCDYLFDKDKIFAYLNLDDNELFIYQRLYDLLARDIRRPISSIYLQASTDDSATARSARRATEDTRDCRRPPPTICASSTRPISTSSSTTRRRRSRRRHIRAEFTRAIGRSTI
jgi:hypothetical protein